MRRLVRISLAAVCAGVIAASLVPTVAPTSAQAPAVGQFAAGFTVPRTADGKPDVNGLWQALNSANWDIQDHPATAGVNPGGIGVYGAQPAGLGIVEFNEIPYQPWALARKKENFEKRLVSDPNNRSAGDPEAKCYMPGVPRATYMP